MNTNLFHQLLDILSEQQFYVNEQNKDEAFYHDFEMNGLTFSLEFIGCINGYWDEPDYDEPQSVFTIDEIEVKEIKVTDENDKVYQFHASQIKQLEKMIKNNLNI